MRKTSAPGKIESGYILIDVLLALIIISIGFTAVFGAMRTAADFSVRSEEKILNGIKDRNELIQSTI